MNHQQNNSVKQQDTFIKLALKEEYQWITQPLFVSQPGINMAQAF